MRGRNVLTVCLRCCDIVGQVQHDGIKYVSMLQGAICSLAMNCDENREAFGRAAGCEGLLEALELHCARKVYSETLCWVKSVHIVFMPNICMLLSILVESIF